LPVDVALNVKAQVYVRINPLYKVILPEIVIAVLPAQVTSPVKGAQNVRLLQSFVVASIVTVYATRLERVSNITSSAAVGRFHAPGKPPEVVAQ
jgi:hypothetical protein